MNSFIDKHENGFGHLGLVDKWNEFLHKGIQHSYVIERILLHQAHLYTKVGFRYRVTIMPTTINRENGSGDKI